MKHSLLCVDDEPDIIAALERLFRKKYTIYKATSALQALEILAAHSEISVIISDQRMPQMSGVEFLEKTQKTHPQAVRILLTGYTDIESVIKAINAGQVYRYVTKPWDPNDLLTAVDQAVEKFELSQSLATKNRALELALAELKTLDSAKNHFMMLVNHELKTPLTVITSYLQLLAETPLNEEQKIFLKRLQSSSYRLQDIVTNVLVLVAAETEQTRWNLKQIGANEIWKPSENMLEIAKKKKVTLRLEIEKVEITADPEIVMQVLNRLTDNALKFCTEATEVVVSGAFTENQFCFSVANQGPAIPEAAMGYILKPFTLIEDVMNHSVGLGLGLPICQALLRLHKSSLKFHCDAGTVRVTFCLSQ